MTMAYSNQIGNLYSYRQETKSVPTLVRNCTTAKLHPYNPSSIGKQRATFTLTIPPITMSSSGYEGFQSFRVYVVVPSSVTSGSGITFISTCDTTNPLLTCQYAGRSSTYYRMLFNFAGTGTATITYL